MTTGSWGVGAPVHRPGRLLPEPACILHFRPCQLKEGRIRQARVDEHALSIQGALNRRLEPGRGTRVLRFTVGARAPMSSALE